MYLCEESRLSAAGTPSQPLALHDYLDQKPQSVLVTYSSTSEASQPSMEEGPPRDSASDQTSGNEGRVSSSKHETPPPLLVSPGLQATPTDSPCAPPQGRLHISEAMASREQTEEKPAQVQLARSESPIPIPPRHQDWQSSRKQITPGRGSSTKKVEWIRGWSLSVAEFGEETYCACGDSPVAVGIDMPAEVPRRGPARAKILKRLVAKPRRDEMVNGLAALQKQHSAVQDTHDTAPPSALAPSPRPKRILCQNCSRSALAVTPPEEDGDVWKKRSRLGGCMKGLASRLFGQSKRGHGHASVAVGQTQPKPAPLNEARKQLQTYPEDTYGSTPQPGPRDGGHRQRPAGGQTDPDEDDNLIDPDELSLSSGEAARPGGGVAGRQARLRRAQRLLERARHEPHAAACAAGGGG